MSIVTRRKVSRGELRLAASATGWNLLGARDIASVAWTRAWSGTPHHAPDVVHALLAALCWPAFAIGTLLGGRWFHRRRHRVVVRLGRMQTPSSFWVLWLIAMSFNLMLQSLTILFHVDVRTTWPWIVGIIVYALAVLVVTRLRRRERTTPAERAGYWRLPGAPRADWILAGPAIRDGDVHAALVQAMDLIQVALPAGATVGADGQVEQDEHNLVAAGFTPVAGERGRVIFTVGQWPDRNPATHKPQLGPAT